MAISHVIGIDDAPFVRGSRSDVRIVGAVFAGPRLEGVLSTSVRRDGTNATVRIIAMIAESQFEAHLQLVMLQGIAVAGFNVIDVPGLNRALGIPVLVIARRAPDLPAIRDALLTRVRGGVRKWKLIEALGPMEPLHNVYIQRVGLTSEEAGEVIARFTTMGSIPEPVRAAHLIAGGIATGRSRGRA